MELREASTRPLEEGDDLPSYVSEESEDIAAGELIAINIDNTTLTIFENTTRSNATVQLRTLKSPPKRSETASLGEPKGDVVEISFFEEGSQKRFDSSLFENTYEFSQQLIDVGDTSDLKYVVIASPGKEYETINLISKSALNIAELSLLGSEFEVSLELKVAHAVVYAVEARDDVTSIIILESSDKVVSKDDDSIIIVGSEDDGSGRKQSTIDCSGLAGGVWVPVPSNPEVGQAKEFCVMKYEAREFEGQALSTHIEKPLQLGIQANSYDQASEMCGNTLETATILTNEMWQTIARNIETAKSADGLYKNWQNGSLLGASSINRGHDGIVSGILAASEDDDNACSGSSTNGFEACGGVWSDGKRTHELSNGSILWDISGNLPEWVSGLYNIPGYPATDGAISIVSNGTEKIFKDMSPQYSYHQTGTYPKTDGFYGGLGSYRAIGNTGEFSPIRGIVGEGKLGIYSMGIGVEFFPSSFQVGFRCAYVPAQ